MQDAKVNPKFLKSVLMDRDIERRVLLPEARRTAAKLEARTPRRTGRTAASTRVEGNHLGAKRDRRAVWVVQSFGAVPMNWRTKRGYILEAIR